MAGEPPLAGLRVLERTTSAAGQAAGMLLADLGADVVRLVGEGDAASTGLPGWLCWNRGKSLVAEADQAIELDRLLRRADVLLHDERPSQRIADALDASAVRQRAPGVVDVWLPSIAPSGRWSELPHDQLLLDAIGGFAAHHPATEDVPVASVVPTRHLIQGGLAAVAALTGVLARDQDGWGRSAVVSGLHAEASTLATFVARSVDGPPILSPGKLLPGPPNFRLYQAGDDRWLFLAALSPDLFIKALEVLDRLDILAHPDVAGDFLNVMRPDVGVTVGAELDATVAASTADEWIARFTAAGVPAALVMDPAEWLRGDVIAHACPPVRRQHPEVGEVLMPGSPLTLSVDPVVPGQLPSTGSIGAAAGVWLDVEPLPVPTDPAPGDDDRPLGGLRVVDTATFLAAPFVATLLAAHGADVVKVESPAGDPYSVFNVAFAAIHEHKPRLTSDLSDAASRAEFLELVATADVVIDNLITSSLARLQLGPEAFAGANPDLVRCSLTAYGAEGPYAELPGFDPIMQTLSGLVKIQGGEGRPIATAAPAHDVATGCIATVGTLAALRARRRRGYGQRVFTSLAAASTYLQSAELTSYRDRPPRPIGGRDFPGPSAFQRFYRAADRWLAVSAATPQQERALLATLDRPAEAEAIAELIVTQPCEHWVERLRAAGVPACAAINRAELDDPFLVEQRYSHVVATPHVGRLELIGGYTDWHHTDRLPPLEVDQLRADRAALLQEWQRRESW